MSNDVPDLKLNNGITIPQLGFGVFQIPPEDTAEATAKALEVGYRHIDTAEMYGNEKGVGEAIRGSGIPRDEIFVTSKLNNGFHEPAAAERAFEQTLADLDIGHVDLFLIHWPLPTRYGGDYVSTWQTLAGFTADGRARAVGVSNFQPDHLARLAEQTGTVPAVNQIEVHPYFTNDAARSASHDAGVLVEAWSPIAQGGGPRGRRDHGDRREGRQVPGPGGAALAPAARRHHLPQVDPRGADAGELRPLRLRAGRRRRGRHQRARQGRGRP